MFSIVSHGHDIRSAGVVSLDQTPIASRIRAPDGVYTVSIEDPVTSKLIYMAINAGPFGVQGKELVRWRGVPEECSSTLKVTLWRQRESFRPIPPKPEGDVSAFVKHHGLRKIDAFDFIIKKY